MRVQSYKLKFNHINKTKENLEYSSQNNITEGQIIS